VQNKKNINTNKKIPKNVTEEHYIPLKYLLHKIYINISKRKCDVLAI